MNAVFQQLYMQPQVRRAVLGCPITAEEESKDCVLYQVKDPGTQPLPNPS